MSGTTPADYYSQIESLGKQFAQYVENRAVDCPRYLALGTNEDSCNAAKTHIADIQNTFFLMTNDLEIDIKSIGKKITVINNQIDKLDQENTNLEEKLTRALNLDAGSQGQITDSQYLYDQELVNNWLIALTMLGSLFWMVWSGGLTYGGVKDTSQVIVQQAARIRPGITSMIPGM